LLEEGAEGSTFIPFRGVRKVIAQRTHRSLSDSAQVTITRWANASALTKAASDMKLAERGPNLNELLMFATSRALHATPELNATVTWEGVTRYSTVNLGFAVDTPRGLLVPVIHGADLLSLDTLTMRTRELANAARAGTLKPDEMADGTFTVSNLGSLGIVWFTPVLNDGQVGILGIGTLQSHSGSQTQIPLSLTFDHRAIDGAAAGRALAALADCIDNIQDVIRTE
jgi:pyruvate dehydrogenase E2 component (dihydrolipoamide acetyltransferase)